LHAFWSTGRSLLSTLPFVLPLRGRRVVRWKCRASLRNCTGGEKVVGHRDGEVGRFGLWICIGDSAPCRCQPPGHLLQKRRESLAAVLILPQRPAASYAKSRTTSAASRCTSRACILSPLHSVSLTPWNLPADTCLSRRCAFYLPF
jgi:hypothetical protein